MEDYFKANKLAPKSYYEARDRTYLDLEEEEYNTVYESEPEEPVVAVDDSWKTTLVWVGLVVTLVVVGILFGWIASLAVVLVLFNIGLLMALDYGAGG